jgi:uncharacterized membrane protein
MFGAHGRHRGFVMSLIAGLVVLCIGLAVRPTLALTLGTIIFFFVYLAIVLPAASRKLTADYLRQHADEEDQPALVIFFVMVAAAVASAVALFLAMTGHTPMGLELALGSASVVLGWFAVHTMMAMHYAWEFYGKPETGRTSRPDGAAGGLEFPGNDDPDGIAFLYFSYVVGMTAQTSDTAISTNAMRRIVGVHGVFAFFFNTVIVAAAVNIAVSMAH